MKSTVNSLSLLSFLFSKLNKRGSFNFYLIHHEEFTTDALQKPPGLFAPCSVSPPTVTGIVKVLHEDQGLG